MQNLGHLPAGSCVLAASQALSLADLGRCRRKVPCRSYQNMARTLTLYGVLWCVSSICIYIYIYIYIFFISVCVVLEMIYILSYNGHYKYNHCISFVMLIIQCPLRDFSAMLWSPECHTFQSRTMRTMRTMRLSRVSLQSIRSTSGQCGSLKIGPPPRWKNLAQNNSETQICREIGYSKHRGLS